MESSDAVQSSWSCSLTAERDPVKEEPEWGEYGVSETTGAEGLDAGHKVKDEFVFELDLVHPQDIAFPMQNADETDSTPECTHTCCRDGSCCNRGTKQQCELESCFVKVEQHPEGDLHTSKPFNMSRTWELSLVPCKQDSVHCGVDDIRAEEVAVSYQPCLRETPSLKQQFPLETCSVSPKHFLLGDLPTSDTIFETKSRFRNQILAHSGNNSILTNLKVSNETVNAKKIVALKNKPKSYSCDMCTKQFRLRTDLTKHRQQHVNETPYGCHMCGKQFTRKLRLINHIQIHTEGKAHSCDICNKQFTVKSTLTKHQRIHTGEKPYSCDVCQKQFLNKFMLNSHMRIHTGVKPYSCNICNNQFRHKWTLTKHQRTHTGEKSYSCDICYKQFTQKVHLTMHLRIHTGEKPHSCDVCNKRFIDKSALTRHLRIHTGDKPYSCNKCNKRFTLSGHLTRHMGIHTGEKAYSCNMCDKRFTRKSGLSLHKQNKGHQDETLHSCAV